MSDSDYLDAKRSKTIFRKTGARFLFAKIINDPHTFRVIPYRFSKIRLRRRSSCICEEPENGLYQKLRRDS